MKILFTTDAVGGIWNYTVDLAYGLTDHRMEVIIACMGPEPDAAQLASLKEKTDITFYHHPYKLEWMDDPWADVAEAGEWLLKINHKEKPDIVHLNGYTHAALNWGRPVIVVGHSCLYTWFQAVEGKKPPSGWDKYFKKVQRGLHMADVVVTPTQAMMKAYETTYGTFAQKEVIYNGIHLPEAAGNVKEPFVFSMGRLWDKAKNIQTLVTAAPHIGCPVMIAGHKSGEGDSLPDNVFFLGQLNRREIYQWLRKASIYVLPVKYEPFGLSFLEAAASECALIGGDIATLHEVWGEAMTYVSPDDPEDIAATCNDLLLNDNKRKRLARFARLRAKEYSLERKISRYLKLYNDVLIESSKYA